jgi:hypothetical protein
VADEEEHGGRECEVTIKMRFNGRIKEDEKWNIKKMIQWMRESLIYTNSSLE